MTLPGGVELLERALGYALGTVRAVTPGLLARPTPCAGWDLRALLAHLNDSLDALHESVATGRLAVPGRPPSAVDGAAVDGAAMDGLTAGAGGEGLTAGFRLRAGRLLGAWTAAGEADRSILVEGFALPASAIAGTGAIEVAVHGWDVAVACGRRAPIPPRLATAILAFSAVVVTDETRSPAFAAPVRVPASASASDRLLAHLGRDPR